MIRLFTAALLVLVLTAACAVFSTPDTDAAPTSAALDDARATIEAATAQAVPAVTATHDTAQFPPLEQLQQTGTPGLAASAADAAPTSQIDSAALTATAIVAQATTAAGGAAAQSAACTPSAFGDSLDIQAVARAQSALEAAGLEPSAVTLTSTGIAGTGAGCADRLTLYATLAITLPIADVEDTLALAEIAARTLAALAELPPESLSGAHPALLALTFREAEGAQRVVVAPYAAALTAYAAGLRGPELLLVLGAA
jgi:hypothetical protein